MTTPLRFGQPLLLPSRFCFFFPVSFPVSTSSCSLLDIVGNVYFSCPLVSPLLLFLRCFFVFPLLNSLGFTAFLALALCIGYLASNFLLLYACRRTTERISPLLLCSVSFTCNIPQRHSPSGCTLPLQLRLTWSINQKEKEEAKRERPSGASNRKEEKELNGGIDFLYRRMTPFWSIKEAPSLRLSPAPHGSRNPLIGVSFK